MRPARLTQLEWKVCLQLTHKIVTGFLDSTKQGHLESSVAGIDAGSLLSTSRKSPSDVRSASGSVFLLCILLVTFRLKTGLEIGVDPADLHPRDVALKRSDLLSSFLSSFLSVVFMVIMDAEYRGERRRPGSDPSNQTSKPETS